MTLLNQSQFAKELGRHRSYVTELKSKGLLVMRAGLVDVEQTKKLLEQAKDPSKQGVVDRHEENRKNKAASNVLIDDLNTEEIDEKYEDVFGDLNPTLAARKLEALVRNEILQEKKNKNRQIDGTLFDSAEVVRSVSNAAAVVRQRLESLPDVLAPQFAAETNEQRIRATLLDQIESLLSEMSRQFYKIGNGG